MKKHKYEVGKVVPYVVISRNKIFIGSGLIESLYYRFGEPYYNMIMDPIDIHNEMMIQDILSEQEIDAAYIKFKKRSLW